MIGGSYEADVEYEKFQQYQTAKLHGRILTPDGLRIICAVWTTIRRKSVSTCWRCWRSSGMKELWNKRLPVVGDKADNREFL